MITTYERHLTLSYLANVASRVRCYWPEAQALADWIMEYGDLLALTGYTGEPRERKPRTRSEKALSATEWRHLRDTLDSERAASKQVRGDRTARQLRCLGREMRLSRLDIAILELLLRYHTQPFIESMVDAVFSESRRHRNHTRIFTLRQSAPADLLGVSVGGYFARFAADAPLVSSGLVSIDDDGWIEPVDRLRRLAYTSSGTVLEARHLLFDTASPSELEWSDFDHVAAGRDHVESLLKGALQAREAGVNVLVYGPPGTGKTQFCRTLADRLGVTLYSVGESDDKGHEPRRNERLQELRLAQRLLVGGSDSILLFDEMEDLLFDPSSMHMPPFGWSNRGRLRTDGSKVYMNRLLEETAVPTLWTSNAARQTCPTVLRRMMFALELRQPSPRIRARIWARQLARHGIASGDEEARSLASEYDVTPGVAAGVTAAARLVDGGDIATVRRGVRSLSRLLSGEQPLQGAPAKFDPALIQADIDPVGLADALAGRGARRLSLCLQGPPGTGKSAFVRYLAERMGLEVVQKRASDLMSKWVGETEQYIAAAFAEARDAEHFLVFDEADSLLADRRFAVRTWEVSQVNEMLTWMESHPLPFACTTNFGQHLDPATLRRFDFKVALDYLAPEQAIAAFRSFFALEPPNTVASLSGLTPGDFAVVRRRAEILDSLQDPEALDGMLREECEAKPDRPKKIGFLSD